MIASARVISRHFGMLQRLLRRVAASLALRGILLDGDA